MNQKNDLFLFSWNHAGLMAGRASIWVHYEHMAADEKRFQPHYHSYYCGFYVTEGEYNVRFGDQVVHVGKQQCILIRPGTRHLVDEGTDAQGYALAVNQELLMDTFLLHMAQNKVFSDFFYKQFLDREESLGYIQLHDQEPGNTVEILKGIAAELQHQDDFTGDLAEIRFVMFLAQLARNAEPMSREARTGTQEAMADILRYIREHSASATLTSTAEAFHYNASYLSRQLSKETGRTFRDWRRQFQMDKAASLLATTDYSVQAISQLVGYSRTVCFYQSFEEVFQMTPSRYREEYRKGSIHKRMRPAGQVGCSEEGVNAEEERTAAE